jgi:hypothetical protein
LQENGALYMLLSNIKRPRFPEQVKPPKKKLFEVCAAAIEAFSFAEQNINRFTCLQ